MPEAKRFSLLFPLLASAVLVLACRSPAPPLPSLGAKPAAPGTAVRRQQQPLGSAEPIAPPAPSTSPEEAADDPTWAQTRAALAARAEHISETQREHLARILVDVERGYGISALLLVALIEHESRFDPLAEGPRGARGLMQIRPFVGRKVAGRIGLPWEGEETLLDPVANVRIGARYLVDLTLRFGSEKLALAAYNMGPRRLARRLARGHDSLPAFVGHVLRKHQELLRELASGESRVGG